MSECKTCVCPDCGTEIYHKKTGAILFEGYMADLFARAIRMARTQEVRYRERYDDKNSDWKIGKFDRCVTADDFKREGLITQYTRLAGLKHWGLLSQREEWWHQGIYQVTEKAAQFIRGEITIPRSVIVARGKVVDFSADHVSFRISYEGEWNAIPDWIRDWRSGSKTQLEFI